jgi:hypothetical protein
MAATLLTATVETIGRAKASKYEGKPDYRPVAFKLPDGSEVWRNYNVGSPELAWLQRGQAYQVVLDGDSVTPVQPEQATSQPGRQRSQPATVAGGYQPSPRLDQMAKEEKAEIISYITSLAGLYAYAYQQAQATLTPHGAALEAIQAAASTTFIQAARRFQL